MKITRTQDFKDMVKTLKEIYREYGITGVYNLLNSIKDDSEAFRDFTKTLLLELKKNIITRKDYEFITFMFGVK